jgi:nucleoside-diphosphate-sugar epimerase
MTERLAFVTGATGFLGGHVARALAQEGWRVRILARSDPSRAVLLSGLPTEVVRGDLSGAADLRRAAAGCDAIVHVAGLTKARTLDDYREVNARGTERLAAAASTASPRATFVLVSSQAAAGPARRGRPVVASDSPHPVSWYGQSKLEGEDAVRRAWKGAAIIVRPAVVYGPGDTGLFTYFRAAASGFLPVPAGRRRIQIGPADWVAMAIARAAGRPDLSGITGFLCQRDPVSIGELARAVARGAPRPPRLFPVPDALVRAAGWAESLREMVTKRSRPFNADKARELLAGEWLCEAGFERELSLPTPRPLETGLRETWDWYLRKGWLNL